MRERPPRLSKKELKEAQKYGGNEDEYDEYEKNDNIPYYDKDDHYERSCFHVPNHLNHKR